MNPKEIKSKLSEKASEINKIIEKIDDSIVQEDKKESEYRIKKDNKKK